MTLYFLGREVHTEGACDDGWVWANGWTGKKWERNWFWAQQLTARP